MAELIAEASFNEKKHTSRYQAETLELEEKLAKSKAKVKVFAELEQPKTELKTSFASRKNASCGKTMQADSYWNVPLLDAPHCCRQGLKQDTRVQLRLINNLIKLKFI